MELMMEHKLVWTTVVWDLTLVAQMEKKKAVLRVPAMVGTMAVRMVSLLVVM